MSDEQEKEMLEQEALLSQNMGMSVAQWNACFNIFIEQKEYDIDWMILDFFQYTIRRKAAFGGGYNFRDAFLDFLANDPFITPDMATRIEKGYDSLVDQCNRWLANPLNRKKALRIMKIQQVDELD